MDLHTPQLQGFFDIPVDHLLGVPVMATYFQKMFGDTSDVVAVSPDVGSVTRTRKFAEWLDIPIAIIDKRRPKANISEIMNVVGDVNNKRVVLIDDLIDTAGTVVNGANALKDIGAKEVYACCTHGVLSGPACERIDKSCIKELVMLNTIPMPVGKPTVKLTSLSIAAIFAEAIERIYGDISISTIFTQRKKPFGGAFVEKLTVIVGLGNPGKNMKHQAHVGFCTIDYLSAKYAIKVNRLNIKPLSGRRYRG